MKKLIAICLFQFLFITSSYSEKTINTASSKYVDLGLSVYWATCNIGADNPEYVGDHFAWGETAPKNEYSWSNYKYSKDNKGKKLSKYVSNRRQGDKDAKCILEQSDDAVQVILGDNWRTPTVQEFRELSDKCRFVLEELNGVMGYRVYSTINDNSIFLPLDKTSLTDMGTGTQHISAVYMTSELNTTKGVFTRESKYAKVFILTNQALKNQGVVFGISPRYLGLIIRPVWDPNPEIIQVPKPNYKVDFDEIAFFTEDNKPDEYSDANPYSYSYMETTTEMDNGYNWAKNKNEEKIREKAVLYRFNGVILLEPIVTTNENTGRKYLYQRFLPINYDPRKYKAPLTDYQKTRNKND